MKLPEEQEQQQEAPSENPGKIFDVSVPPGVPPHGFFQALCAGVVVDVQAPPDAYPGQLVRIDLSSGEHCFLFMHTGIFYVTYTSPGCMFSLMPRPEFTIAKRQSFSFVNALS
jgi:hypothetical protein